MLEVSSKVADLILTTDPDLMCGNFNLRARVWKVSPELSLSLSSLVYSSSSKTWRTLATTSKSPFYLEALLRSTDFCPPTAVEEKMLLAHFLRVPRMATSCLSMVDFFPENAYGASADMAAPSGEALSVEKRAYEDW